jgi:drug/metabolite transporter (DMT)-like permease
VSQTPLVLGLVLLAAVLHAVWNALIKSSADAWLTMLMVFGTGSAACALGLPFVEPPARESWPWLAAGIALHNGYVVFLLLSYRVGDLSHVYPLARGTGPLLVALLSGRVVGEHLSASLALDRSVATPAGRRAASFALATGVWVAGYTLVDAMGVRRAGSTLGYIVWLQAAEALPFLLASLAIRRRAVLRFAASAAGRRGAAGGLMATLAYSLVLWAYSLGAVAPIAALRETSTLIAALIGTLLLGEPFGGRRILAALLVVAGLVALNL